MLVAGVGLLFVPADVVVPIRALVRDALRPGQAIVRGGLARSREWLAAAVASQERKRARELEEELRSAQLQIRRLELQVAGLRERSRKLAALQGLAPASNGVPPLVTPRLIEARVLGEETAALWRGRKLLSAGGGEGVTESALVLDDARPLVDVGDDANVITGDAVYAGQIVIGKIAETGRYSSTLRLVTDPAYTGRARLARRTSRGLVFGTEGTIVGDGSDLCRLKHISEPVNIGDEVVTGENDGVLPGPMYYGKVVRAELEPGAREWLVWVEPAATTERLESVLILRRTLNPDRILAN